MFRTNQGHYSSKHHNNSTDPNNNNKPVSKARIRISVLLNRIGMYHKEDHIKAIKGHINGDKCMQSIRLMQRL